MTRLASQNTALRPLPGAAAPHDLRNLDMNKDRIEGAAKQAAGSIKQAVGELTGDAKLKADGAVEKAEGKVQNAVGGLKDAAKK